MTGPASAPPDSTTNRAGPSGPGLSGLVWLTWRQHRWTIAGTAVVVAGYAAWMLLTRAAMHDRDSSAAVSFPLDVITIAEFACAGAIGVFWGAPLVTREYELGTHLLAWGQDVSPARWMLAKTGLLAVPAVAMAAVFGVVTGVPLARYDELFGAAAGPFPTSLFEAWWPLQAAYAMFALALGVAVGVRAQRTPLSMGATLVGYLTVRAAVSGIRLYFLPPLRATYPVAGPGPDFEQHGGVPIDFGFLNASGDEVNTPDCLQFPGGSSVCYRSHGITHVFQTYQPASRAPLFHIIELAIFLVLAAGLSALAYRRLRHRARV